MRTVRFAMLAAVVLAATQISVYGQTITFNGSVPATYSILNASDAALTDVDATFVSAIGVNTLTEATHVIHLRSNAVYKLSAIVGTPTNIGTGVATVAGSTLAAIQLGDIGFGISAINVLGASVVNGGSTPTRTDTVVVVTTTGPNFNYTSPTAVNGRMTANPFPATLYNITSATQLLSGDRISASGDNGSTDNFMGVSLKFGYVPQYFTPETAFSFVVTLTIASSV